MKNYLKLTTYIANESTQTAVTSSVLKINYRLMADRKRVRRMYLLYFYNKTNENETPKIEYLRRNISDTYA